MRRELLEKLQRQLRPEGWLALMVGVVAFTVLAVYLYLLKPSLTHYRELAAVGVPGALEGSRGRTVANAAAIAELEQGVAELRSRLYGSSSGLPLEKMESHIIDRLDLLSAERGVELVSVTPGETNRVLMFDELPYDVDVAGDYFALYAWLAAVEEELRPMVVKRFEMSRGAGGKDVTMRLRLVSYRPRGGDA